MYSKCNIKGKEHLLIDSQGNPVTLDEWAKQGWSTNDDMLKEQYTLISEEKNEWVMDDLDIRHRWYFRKWAQHYNDYNIHEHYGYKPFREANPDLCDITGSRKSFDDDKKIDDSSFYKEYNKIYKQYQEHECKNNEEDKELSKHYRNTCRRMLHERNVKTRGWNSCRTYYHAFYHVTLDVKENCLAYEEPYSIDTKTMKMLLKEAPFIHLWSDFGIKGGKDYNDVIWFTKDKLASKAYKK